MGGVQLSLNTLQYLHIATFAAPTVPPAPAVSQVSKTFFPPLAQNPIEKKKKSKMPFVPVEIPKCPKCAKSVYAAEERVAAGLKFHKQCFKCNLCNKMLDSTNANEHQGELFCRVCHARKFGPKGYGFGGGAGAFGALGDFNWYERHLR